MDIYHLARSHNVMQTRGAVATTGAGHSIGVPPPPSRANAVPATKRDIGKPPWDKGRVPPTFAGRKMGSKSTAPRKRELHGMLASAIASANPSVAQHVIEPDFLTGRLGISKASLNRFAGRVGSGEIMISDAVSELARLSKGRFSAPPAGGGQGQSGGQSGGASTIDPLAIQPSLVSAIATGAGVQSTQITALDASNAHGIGSPVGSSEDTVSTAPLSGTQGAGANSSAGLGEDEDKKFQNSNSSQIRDILSNFAGGADGAFAGLTDYMNRMTQPITKAEMESRRGDMPFDSVVAPAYVPKPAESRRYEHAQLPPAPHQIARGAYIASVGRPKFDRMVAGIGRPKRTAESSIWRNPTEEVD